MKKIVFLILWTVTFSSTYIFGSTSTAESKTSTPKEFENPWAYALLGIGCLAGASWLLWNNKRTPKA